MAREEGGISRRQHYFRNGLGFEVRRHRRLGSGLFRSVQLRFQRLENHDGHTGRFQFREQVGKMRDDVDIVFVMGGTNDYGHGREEIAVPFGDFSDREPTTFFGALHTLFQGLIRKYLGKKIVILIPPHRKGFGSFDDLTPNPETGKIFPEYLDAIRKTAEYYGLPILDLYRNLPLNPVLPEIREKYIPDGLHPNEEGHRLIAEAILNFLKTF